MRYSLPASSRPLEISLSPFTVLSCFIRSSEIVCNLSRSFPFILIFTPLPVRELISIAEAFTSTSQSRSFVLSWIAFVTSSLLMFRSSLRIRYMVTVSVLPPPVSMDIEEPLPVYAPTVFTSSTSLMRLIAASDIFRISSRFFPSDVRLTVIWVLSISGIMENPFFIASAANSTKSTTEPINTAAFHFRTVPIILRYPFCIALTIREPSVFACLRSMPDDIAGTKVSAMIRLAPSV